jgi:transposase
VSNPIALCQDGITEWLRFPHAMVHDIKNYEQYTELIIQRTPPVLRFSGCGQLYFDRYDRYRQRLRDLDVFELETYPILDKWRVHCPNCGFRVEDLGFARPYSRASQRFEELVAYLCQLMPVANVAELLGLDWKAVKEIDKRALQREFT